MGRVAAAFDLTRIAVMYRIRVLDNCDLMVSRKESRRRLLYHNPVPVSLGPATGR